MRLGRRSYFHVLTLGLAVAATAAVVALLMLRGTGTAAALPAPNSGPALVSQGQLQRLAASTEQPVYWAGPKHGFSYELTRTSDGRIYIRYLPLGVKAGDPRPDFLVVGTYTQSGSFADLGRAATRKGTVRLDLAHGGVALFNAARPTSVYFSFPGAGYQVEVYEPSGDSARTLVLAGKIAPIS